MVYFKTEYSLVPPDIDLCSSWCILGARAPNKCEGKPLASRRAKSKQHYTLYIYIYIYEREMNIPLNTFLFLLYLKQYVTQQQVG